MMIIIINTCYCALSVCVGFLGSRDIWLLLLVADLSMDAFDCFRKWFKTVKHIGFRTFMI